MSLVEKIKSLFKRSKEIEEKVEEIEEKLDAEKVEEIVSKAQKVDIEEDESIDPWQDFKTVCKEVGVDYREVISKAAWYYLEETGGAVNDPLMQVKEVVSLLREFENTVKDISEPKSVKKLKMYNEALKEVAEFKEKLQEVKSGKITAKDLIPLLTKLMKQS